LPRYTYRCKACQKYFEVSHSITEKLTDCKCGEKEALTRVPSVPFRVSTDSEPKTGQLVKEFIDDTKKDIEEYKKELAKGVQDE
jgi:putative FmdB family regulatory protein